MRTFFIIIACLGLLLVFAAAAPAILMTREILAWGPANFTHPLGNVFGTEFLYFWGWYPAIFGVLLALVGGLIARPRFLWIPLVAVGLFHILSFTGEYVYVAKAARLMINPWLTVAQTVAPGLVCIIEGLVLRRIGTPRGT
jgi:hypothetical protein